MNTSCPSDWTKQSELSILTNCDIPIIGVLALKLTVIGLAFLILLVELIIWGYNYHSIKGKGNPTLILLIWTVAQNLIMSLRPMVGLSAGITPRTTLWLAFLTHISAASAAGIVILFIYIQVKILAKSAMGKTNWLYSNKKIILTVLGFVQAILFLLGPFGSHFLNLPLYQMFWIPVVIIDFTVIPYFCVLGILIYHKISHMQRDDSKATGRRLLLTVLLCSVLGLFTGAVGIYASIANTYEWALIELCWLADIVFNAIFFGMFVRAKK